MKKNKKNKKGFTMIELLAAIVIVGILSTIGIVSVLNLRTNQRDNFNNTQNEVFSQTAETYFADNRQLLPKTPFTTEYVTLGELIQDNYLTASFLDFDKNAYKPESKVYVTKLKNGKYVYRAELILKDETKIETITDNKATIEFTYKNQNNNINKVSNIYYTNNTPKIEVTMSDTDKIGAYTYQIYRNSKVYKTSEYIYVDELVNFSDTISLNTKDFNDGEYRLRVTVYDSNGNSISKNSALFVIDTQKPTCNLNINGTKGDNDWYKEKNVTINLEKNDEKSGIASYGLTNTNTPTYNSKTSDTQSDTTSSGVKWYGYVKDNAGNTNKCETTLKVDTKKPTCEISLTGTKGDNDWYKEKNVTVKLSKKVDDGSSGLAFYGLINSRGEKYNNVLENTQSDISGITWYGYVKDNAGNTNECNSGSFKVDTVKPVCSFSAPNDYTIVAENTAKIDLTCTDSLSKINSSVHTLTTNNFTVSSDAAKVTHVTEPTGVTNGYKYTVTITGVKYGVFNIGLKSNSIKDTAGNYNNGASSVNMTAYNKAVVGQCNTAVTYDDKPHTLASGGTGISFSNNEGTDVTTYIVTMTPNSTYMFSDEEPSKTINCSGSIIKRKVTYRANDQSKTYDGDALNADTSCTLTAGSLVSGHSATCPSNTGSQTNAGTSTKTLTEVVIKRNSDSKAVTSNYEITRVNGVLKVNKATPVITLSPVSDTVVQDKSMNFTATVNAETKANCKGTLKAVSSNTNVATVTPGTSSITAPKSGTSVTETVSGVNAGTSTITVSFTPDDTTNFNNAGEKKYSATIMKKALIPKESDYCSNPTYSGSKQSIVKTAGEGFKWTAGNEQINANYENTYTVTATLLDGYRWEDNATTTKTIKCSMRRATPVITLDPTSGTVVQDKTMNFTATVKSGCAVSVDGTLYAASGKTDIATVSPASVSINATTGGVSNTETVTGVAAGTSTITVNFTPTDAYKGNFNSAAQKTYSATVMKKALIPTASNYCKTGLIYNGSSQTLVNDAGTGYTWTDGTTRINAGSQDVTATLSSGYRWEDNSTGTKKISCGIGKATPTITLDPTSGETIVGYNLTFNEKATVKGKFTVSSSDSGKATVAQNSNNEIAANTNNLVTVTPVAVGSATITVNFTPTDTTNYNNAPQKTYSATIRNTAQAPTASGYCKTGLVYNGSSQNLVNAAGTGYTWTAGTTRINAGSQDVTATLSAGYRWNDNSTGTKKISCSIAKATPVISLNSTSGTVVAGKTLSFTATVKSGCAVSVDGTLGVVSGMTSVATVSPGSVSINATSSGTSQAQTVSGVSDGSSTITVSFVPNSNYSSNFNSATQKTYSATITKKAVIPTASGYCKTGLVYNKSSQTLVNNAGTGYSWTSGTTRTDAGSQNVTATLSSGYRWEDNSTGTKTINCSIAKADGFVNLSSGSRSVTYGTKSISFTVTSHHGGSLSVYSDGGSASITDSTVNLTNISGISAGTDVVVNVTSSATTNYNSATVGFVLTIIKQRVLPVTNLAVGTDGVVSWTNSSNATGYQISFNGEDYATPTTSKNYLDVLTDSDEEKTVYVRAINSDTTNYDSPSSVTTVSVVICHLSLSGRLYGTVSDTEINVIKGTTYSTSNNVLYLKSGSKTLHTVTATTYSYYGYTVEFDYWIINNGSSATTSGTINDSARFAAIFYRNLASYNACYDFSGVNNMNLWKFQYPETFSVYYPQPSTQTQMSEITFTGQNSKWEMIYIPIATINGTEYTVTFDYEIVQNYSTGSGYSGIVYQILKQSESITNGINDSNTVSGTKSNLPKTKTSGTKSVTFTATGGSYLAFNFGTVTDGTTIKVKIGKIRICTSRSYGSWQYTNPDLELSPSGGYQFDGYYTSDGTKVQDMTMPANDITYYASYSAKLQSLIFDFNTLNDLRKWQYYHKDTFSVSPSNGSNSITINAQPGKWEIIYMPVKTDIGSVYNFKYSVVVSSSFELFNASSYPGIAVQALNDISSSDNTANCNKVNYITPAVASRTDTLTFKATSTTTYLAFNFGMVKDGTTATITLGKFQLIESVRYNTLLTGKSTLTPGSDYSFLGYFSTISGGESMDGKYMPASNITYFARDQVLPQATIVCYNKYQNGEYQTIAACANGTVSNAVQKDPGNYTISCTPNSGYSTPSNTTCSIYADTSPPTCSITPSGTMELNGWYRSNVNLTMTYSDNIKVASFGLTTASSATYNSLSTATQGETSGVTWYGYVKDQAGNTNYCTTTLKVDVTAPSSVSASSTNLGKWVNSGYKLSLSAVDATSGVSSFQYKYADGTYSGDNTNFGAFQSLSISRSGTTYTATSSEFSKERNTAVYVRACDNAGNCSSDSYSPGSIKIDKTAPDCTNVAKIGSSSGSKYDSGKVTCDNVYTSATCNEKGSFKSGCASKKTITTTGATRNTTDEEKTSWDVKAAGTSTVTWKVYDSAGNSKACSKITVKKGTNSASASACGSSCSSGTLNSSGTCTVTSGFAVVRATAESICDYSGEYTLVSGTLCNSNNCCVKCPSGYSINSKQTGCYKYINATAKTCCHM